MNSNVGSFDKLVRIILGIALLAASFYFKNWVSVLSVVGAVLLVTGLINFCPLYKLIGFSSKS